MSNKYYTTAEVAEILNVKATTVRKWLAAGKIESVLLAGCYYRVSQEALDAFIKENSKND